MNSTQWQEKIAALATEIETKKTRLRSLAALKVQAIEDEKRLSALEREEEELPNIIERLMRRQPLLESGLMEADKVEAGGRRKALAQEREGLAKRVGEETKEVRRLMGEVLQKTRGAQETWGMFMDRGGENEYLRIKFSGSPLPESQPPDRMTREEINRFVHDLEQSLRHETVSASRWSALTVELSRERIQADAQTRHDTEHLSPSEQMVRERQVQQDFLNRMQHARERDAVAAAKAYNDKTDERTNVRQH